MRVTRITLDAELGLIELKTGPGGDGDYVLLPIPVPKLYERYIALDSPAELSIDDPATAYPEKVTRSLPNPVMAFAKPHGKSGVTYRLTSPTLPGWWVLVQVTEMEMVPTLVRGELRLNGYDVEGIAVALIFKEADR